jgi:ABC-type methionine transport system permease subunit
MAVICSAIIGLILGFFIGVLVCESDRTTYKKCRYYNQTIERCVTEIGWEKK